MRYPEVGERVDVGGTWGGGHYTVTGITDRGDVIVRGTRLDDIQQVPVEAIRRDPERAS